MAHFAILSPPEAGHVYPLGAIGLELIRRGHRVTVIARPKAAPILEELNLPLHTIEPEGIPFPSSPWLWTAFSLFKSGWLVGFRNSFAWAAEAQLRLLPDIFKTLGVEGVISDQIFPACGTAAERVGLPFVTVCTAPPWNVDVALPPAFTSWNYAEGRRAELRNRMGYAVWRWFMQPALRVVNRYRRRWNMRRFRRIDDCFSPLAQISQLFAEMDFPRSAAPACFHYVGSLAADRPYDAAGFPWDRLDGRPLIYASLGTIADPMNRPVYPRIAAACAGLDAQLVLALGKWNDETAGREHSHALIGDPIVADYAPQLALLDRAAVLITHAGLNTTLEAVSRAVPMVALARSADQPGNASRIEYSGAGLRASFHRGTAAELREIVRRVLTDERFRRRAQELQKAMRAAGGARCAAEIAEQALTTGRPVLRKP